MSAAQDVGSLYGARWQAEEQEPHVNWLLERNRLLAAADEADAETPEYEQMIGAVCALEQSLQQTSAKTKDGLLARCLLAVHLNGEGFQIADEFSRSICADAKAVLG